MRRRDAIAIIVGIVVGAGIFKTPSMVAGIAGDVGWVMVAWALGALISLAGALCYAEIATAYPHAGGDYHFLTRAYGRHLSFLYAWARAMVINTGSIALLAFVFGDYMAHLIPLGSMGGVLWATAVVLALTAINVAGLRASARTQNVLTAIEVFGLVAVAVAGFLMPAVGPADPAPFSTSPSPGMLGLAMVFVLLTYGGWNEAAYISAEIRGSRRAIVTALIASIAIIAAAYLAVNAALLNGLGLKGLADSKAAGADVMQRAFGTLGVQTRRARRCDRRADIHQCDDDRRRAHHLRVGTRLVDAALCGGMASQARYADCRASGRRERSRWRWSGSARCSRMGSRRWWSSRRRYSGRFSCSSGSLSSCCV